MIRADRLELRETPEGYQLARAIGSSNQLATYRQKRDAVDEMVQGQAQRIDYDSQTGTLRFEGAAQVQRLRGAAVADEVQGAVIIWDSVAETFNVRGGAANAGNPGGRVRAVIAPRQPVDAARSAASAASGLQPSTALGDRR
jgi:lipopolysaccharide export system protein LptA